MRRWRTTRQTAIRRWKAALPSTPWRSAPTTRSLGQGRLEGSPSFAKLVAHVQPYSPEWAATICDVPAETIRRIANEFLDHAQVGATIEIEGKTLPYRPVSIEPRQDRQQRLGRLRMLLGTHPARDSGRRAGSSRRHAGHDGAAQPAEAERLESVKPGPDGFMHYPMNPTDREDWSARPQYPQRPQHPGAAGRQLALEPGARADASCLDVAKGDAQGLAHGDAARGLVRLSHQSGDLVLGYQGLSATMARFPFVVAMAYTRDETNHMADILLPDAPTSRACS